MTQTDVASVRALASEPGNADTPARRGPQPWDYAHAKEPEIRRRMVVAMSGVWVAPTRPCVVWVCGPGDDNDEKIGEELDKTR